MNTEQQKIEYKSLQKIRTGEKGFKELSTTCVALANAQGGQIMIGVEDKTKKPAPNQVISQEEANSAVTRLRGLCFNVGLAVGDICADETGSQYFAITVFPSLHSYATTSDGLRAPMVLMRLSNFVWSKSRLMPLVVFVA